MPGKFIISLDFELHWGGIEIWDIGNKKDYFLNTRKIIPRILELFEINEIKATWATVGYLFAKDKEQLISFVPDKKPSYKNEDLSSYNYFNLVGDNEETDPFHFAYSLIEEILNTKGQELASHTFSHYYCTEPGQRISQFEADLKAAQDIALTNFGRKLTSLVFPRNQYSSTYLKIAGEQGINVVRTNPNVWFWEKTSGKLTSLYRALDTLTSISRTLTFKDEEIIRDNVVELSASRFFRPYNKKEKWIQNIKISRMKKEMLYAAKNNTNYHLWWHPHNFGAYPEMNMEQLKTIIEYYNVLKKEYGFMSCAMNDFA